MRRAHLIAVSLLALGCTRSFTAPQGHLELGQACTSAAACASGSCSDGVCCDSACGGTRVCNLAEAPGRCRPRPLGAACDGPEGCPSGFCRDGVCCDTACTDNCTSCDVDGGAGHCQLAPDDTDPHRDCGSCAACFGGACGPAFADTDPHHECPEGRTCSGNYSSESAGVCGIADGYPCENDDCAGYGGYCIGWRCLEVSYFHVDDYPLLRLDRHRTPVAMGVGPGGDTAILVNTDDGIADDGGYLGSVVAVVAPSTHGPWTTASVEYNAVGRRLGAVAFTGDIAFFAVDSMIAPDAPEAAGYGYSGIYIQGVSSTGQLQGFDDPDPGATALLQIAFASDAHGRLTLASVADGGTLRTVVRGVDGHWGNVATRDLGASGVALATTQGETRLFAVAEGALVLALPDGGEELAPGATGGCSGPLSASSAPDPDGDLVGLTLSCSGQPYLAVFSPDRPDLPRWRVVPAPADSPLYGLEDDGTRYPLTRFLPSGGRAGSAIFTALEPGDAPGAPRGGYTQTLWVQPDGGLAYAYFAGADNGYRYAAMAAAGSPTGAPISAYDSIPDDDGGALDTATLLIQTYAP